MFCPHIETTGPDFHVKFDCPYGIVKTGIQSVLLVPNQRNWKEIILPFNLTLLSHLPFNTKG